MDRLLGADPAADRFLASPSAGGPPRRTWRTATVAAAAAAATLALVGTVALLTGGGRTDAAAGAYGGGVTRSSGPSPRRVKGHDKDCGAGDYSKTTLKLVADEPIVRLISERAPDGSGDAVPIRKFEASDVAGVAGGDHVLVVFDNSFKVAHLASGLTYMATDGGRADSNYLLTWPGDDGSDSQFEAITYNATAGTYVVIQESVLNESGHMVPRLMEVSFANGAATVHSQCDGHFTFTSENKGFEGAAIATAADGTSYLLALCEGNFCAGGKAGRKPGNGRLIVMERAADAAADGSCAWVPVQTVPIPPSADFMDYSAISIYNNTRVAITSQENAAVWVGDLVLGDGSPVHARHRHRGRAVHGDHGAAAGVAERDLFGLTDGTVWDFPRNALCERIFCTVEGIHWQESDKLVAVSDQMKSGGKQPFVCMEHDQSVHTFLIPA